MSGDLPLNINIKEPRWDQSTFMGRAQHFFMVTDPRNVLLSSEVLEDARVTVENYRSEIFNHKSFERMLSIVLAVTY